MDGGRAGDLHCGVSVCARQAEHPNQHEATNAPRAASGRSTGRRRTMLDRGVRDAHPFEPADGFGEDLRTAPSDATKNIGQWTADADEVVAAVEARAEYDPRSPKQGDISREKFRRERDRK